MQKTKKMKKGGTLFTKDFILLICVSLITAFGYSMMSSLVSSYTLQMGAGVTLAGVASGIFSLAALISRPFSGYATDIFNKKTMCVMSTALISLSVLGYLMAPNVGLFIVIRIIHGIAFGISGTANLALVSEYIPPSKTGEGLGYYGIGQVIAQVLGPTVGIYIRDTVGYRFLYAVIAFLTMAAAMLLIVCLKERKQSNREKTGVTAQTPFSINAFFAKECVVYALVAGLFSAGNGIVASFLLPLAEERGIPNISLFFSINAIVLFLMRLTIGKLIDKTDLLLIAVPSLLVSAFSFGLIGYSSSFWIVMIAAVFKALGHGGGQISLQSACIKCVPPGRVGVATATFYIGADIGQGFGSILGGKISSVFNYGTMFYLTAIVIVVVAGLFTIYEIHRRKTVPKDVR